MTIYFCCDQLRRNAVNNHPTVNGIDFLEVLDNDAPLGSPRQRTLLVRCLKAVPALTGDNVEIEGGERVKGIGVEWAFPAPLIPPELTNAAEETFFGLLDEPDHVLVVRTDSDGDFSTYRLRLATSPTDATPPPNFDTRLFQVDFSFKVECPTDFDCKPRRICPPEVPLRPEIDYLSKDFASFRRLMLDRISLLSPKWTQRNATTQRSTIRRRICCMPR